MVCEIHVSRAGPCTNFTDIYGHRKNVQKSKAYLPMVPEGDGWCTLTCIDKSRHHQKRRLITQGLSDQALKQFEPALLANIRTFCDKLGEGGPRNIDSWTDARNMNDYSRCFTTPVFDTLFDNVR